MSQHSQHIHSPRNGDETHSEAHFTASRQLGGGNTKSGGKQRKENPHMLLVETQNGE